MAMAIVEPNCFYCKHLHLAGRKAEKWKCDAFLNGIPERIVSGEIDHTDSYPGDHGIQFEPIEADNGKETQAAQTRP